MQTLDEMIKILEARIKPMFAGDKTGHDIGHLKRTMRLAMRMQKTEGGNPNVIAISALLHDIHRIMTGDQRNFVHPKASIPKIRELIADLDLTDEERDHICHAVEHHEEYNFSPDGVTVTDIESLILQDADNIDATGAIGIGRTFTFGSTHGIPFYDDSVPLVAGEFYEGMKFDPSTIHHCVNKLARLYQTMNTKTGKTICRQRCDFVEAFVKQFIEEWGE
jgi:uncharacterized protein